MKQEEITKVAQDLTKWQLTTTGWAIETYKSIVEKKAPKIEPVVKWDYKAFASSIKNRLQTNNDTVELTGDFIKSLFPQAKCAGDVVKNLKRYYGLSYRRDWKKYIFFIEPTREELIVQLTSAESRVIELEKEVTELIRDKVNICQENAEQLKSKIKELQKDYQERYDRWWNDLQELWEENEQLKKDAKRISILIDFNLILTLIRLWLTLYTNHR